jgi:hypothetical protein
MTTRLTSLGYARVFRHPRTGELAVDTDSLRRSGGGFSGVDFGEDDVEGDEDWDDEDDDDSEFEGDDDFGDDLEGDDDIGDDDVGSDDFGARGDRRRRRLNRRLGRLNKREDRIKRKLGNTRGKRKGSKMQWGMTAVSSTDTLAAAGSASVKLRLQHHFKAHDITFTGSASGAKVTSIFFGDRVVWSSSDGIDVSVFGTTSLLRGLLKGQSLRAGLDITVNGSLTGAGDFAVTLIGQKPVSPTC